MSYLIPNIRSGRTVSPVPFDKYNGNIVARELYVRHCLIVKMLCLEPEMSLA